MRTFLLELVSDILLRLPVKSLLRFRCLSTSLCREIDSPDFVKNHLNGSILSKSRQKLIINNKNGTHFYAMDFDGGLKETSVVKYPFKSPSGSRVAIGGSCNGLILLVLGKSSKLIALWLSNPFTRQYKKIPPCPAETLSGYKYLYRLGLGHDPAHDDYKIVMISAFYYDRRLCFQSWVFSLKKNSWRRRQDWRVKLQDQHSTKASFANGALYWQCNNGHDRKIVGFNLTKEVFFKMPLFVNAGLPQNSYFFYNTMVVFGGKLYNMELTAEGKTLEFYLKMSDKGRPNYWKKVFEIEDEEIERALNANASHCIDLPSPLAYSKDGDSILFHKNNEIFWYNPETKSRQRVEILGIPPAQSEGYGIHVCWESLVSLGNESAFDAAPEKSRIEKLREIAAAANMTGMNLAYLGCVILFLYFDFWLNLFILGFFALLFCYLSWVVDRLENRAYSRGFVREIFIN